MLEHASECYLTPGIGLDYEFRPGATGCFGTGGFNNFNINYIDQCGTNMDRPIFNPSVPIIRFKYSYSTSFLWFISRSIFSNWLSIKWKLEDYSHRSFRPIDNGFIFNWGIEFDESLTT
jgi:hypothetical protein